jgi:Ca-activated chloride channel family protein
MEVAGRVVEGVLKERAEARRAYDEALRAGHRAAITEEERPDIFTLRVGNVMPGETAVVRLTLSGPLAYSEGEVTFRFPLVVAPRYIPGRPLPGPSVGDGVVPDTDSVPDASRITPPVLLPGFPNPVRLSLAVEVRPAGLPVGDLRASLHAVAVTSQDGAYRVSLQPGDRLNRDFLLRYRLGEQNIRTALVVRPDAGTQSPEGTFLLSVVPPTGQAPATRPRDVVFVLDRSGSMGGWKMVAARRALGRMVDTLTDQDRLAVYAFDDRVETVPAFAGTGLVPATNRHRFQAVEFLARIEARGGTDMARPLVQAVTTLTAGPLPQGPPRDRILVLVTDGQVGNEDQLLRTLGPQLKDLRIFTLGIDQAVNAGFLQRLAGLGGGACELVESEDRLDEVMAKIHRRLGTPVLTGLRLEPAGIALYAPSLVPARLPDLFAGTPLVIQGRYRGAAQGTITVQGQDAAGGPWSEAVAAQLGDNPAITAAWARGFVRELEDRYVVDRGEKAALEKQIVQTSLRFGVLCRFTAFLAVDVQEVVNPDGQVHRVTQPVEPAAGWAMLGTDAGESLLQMTLAATNIHGAMPPAAALRRALADELETLCEEEVVDRSDAARRAPSRPLYARRPSAVERFLRRVTRFFRRKPDEAKRRGARKRESADLTAYRQHAGELLHQLRAAVGGKAEDRLSALGAVAVQLVKLLEDLGSIGAPTAELQPLTDLLAQLQGGLAHWPVAEETLDKLYRQTDEVLQRFSQATDQPAGDLPKQREGFWK